jgi:uridine kinase
MALFIGIAGGTGSGKSTITNEVVRKVGKDKVAILPHDAYYRRNDHLTYEQRCLINYDHPDSIENELFVEHILKLSAGELINLPVYDFSIHNRTDKTIPIFPKEIIIVEGILILADKEIRKHLDIKVFVDTPPDIRLLRRINRDMKERGRTLESVEKQYIETVRPMHLEFVEPSKQFADIIVPEGGYNRIAVDMIVSQIMKSLSEKGEKRRYGEFRERLL